MYKNRFVSEAQSPDLVENAMMNQAVNAVLGRNPPAPLSWQEEIDRTAQRFKNLWELITDPQEPAVGITPRTEIYRKNKSRLFRYKSGRRHKTPLLFIPNLGISRPYIFDLMPGSSFIEYMTQEQGFDMYLIDWGTFGPEDSDMTLEYAVTKILPRLARKALEASGASEISILGYCMGASLSASFLGSHPEFPVKNFINTAGPIDFSKTGLFAKWMDPRFFDVDKYVDTLGDIPGSSVKLGFSLLQPTNDLTTQINLWRNLWNPDFVTGFQAMHQWANTYLPFPGAFFRQLVKDLYQQNRLYRGGLTMAGREVDLKNITCPVLVISATEDNIAPPECVQPLIDAVGGTDREYATFRAGHISLIAGRGAANHSWPRVAAWLAARS